MPMKLMTLKADEEDVKRWKAIAEKAGLGLSEWIRERCNGGDHRAVHVPVDTAVGEAEGREHGTAGDAGREPVRPAKEFTELERIVASRTGHPLGHECFQCLQTARMFAPVAISKPAKQRGKR